MSSKNKFRIAFLLFLVVIASLVWREILLLNNKEGLKVVFFDIGQGDSIFIETKRGVQVLIDGGPNNNLLLREIGKQVSFFDKEIDVVISTHPDADHIGGLVPFFDKFDANFYLESGNKSDSLIYASLEEALSNEGVTRLLARQGTIIDLGDGVYIEILFPDREASGLEPNMASIIVKVSYGDTSFLLTGDSPIAIENYISTLYGNSLKSDVLKLGHHGSKTSTSNMFLGLVSPSYAVVSAGEGNRYGHPHQEIISKVKKFEVEIFETSKNGSIVFYSDGTKVSTKK